MAQGRSVFCYFFGSGLLLLCASLLPTLADAGSAGDDAFLRWQKKLDKKIAEANTSGGDDDDEFLRWQAEQAEQIGSPDDAVDPSEASLAGSRQAFEALLKESFFGSYSFYKQLSDSDKVDVFQHYHKTGSITETRRLIMRHFMNR